MIYLIKNTFTNQIKISKKEASMRRRSSAIKKVKNRRMTPSLSCLSSRVRNQLKKIRMNMDQGQRQEWSSLSHAELRPFKWLNVFHMRDKALLVKRLATP